MVAHRKKNIYIGNFMYCLRSADITFALKRLSDIYFKYKITPTNLKNAFRIDNLKNSACKNLNSKGKNRESIFSWVLMWRHRTTPKSSNLSTRVHSKNVFPSNFTEYDRGDSVFLSILNQVEFPMVRNLWENIIHPRSY